MKRVFATIAAATLLLTIGATGTAVAGHLIGSSDIRDNSIRSRDIHNGTIKVKDLNPNAIQALKGANGTNGTNGTNGQDGKDGKNATLGANSTSNPTVVTNIGGTFGKFTGTVRATKLDETTLTPGTYQVTANGFFHSNVAVSGLTRLQLAVRVDDGTDWGQDLGTCFTGATSPLADREATCSTTRVVTITAPTTVQVYAFGYADDQGSADSGKFTAVSYLSAVKASN